MNGLNAILEKVLQYMEKGEDFLTQQAPDFCKQLVEYAAWEAQWSYDISFWFTVAFALISLVFLIKSLVCDYSDGAIAVITGLVFIVAFSFTVSAYKDLRMYEKAPKVYLVKVVKNLMIENSN